MNASEMDASDLLDDEEENEEDDDGLEIPPGNIFFHKDFEKVILSIFWRNGRLGAAVFHEDSVEIHLLNDTADVRPHFIICNHLIYEIRPNTVIVSKTILPIFLQRIERAVDEINEEEKSNCSDPEEQHKIRIEFLSSKHFKYEVCKSLVMKMNILDKMKNLLEENRLYFLHSLINFNCKVAISAMGALLYFLDAFVSKVQLHVPSQHILGVKLINLKSLVCMDRESYSALEIFAPNGVGNSGSCGRFHSRETKKNFCLYTIFNRCSSAMGSQYLRSLMAHPIRDMKLLKQRHEVIEYFLSCENDILIKNLQNCLKHIHNLNKIILRIIGTQATSRQWKTFYNTIHNALIIGQVCRNNEERCSIFKEISGCLDDSLYIMAHVIETIVDFEDFSKVGRFTVKKGPFPELDEIKARYKELPKLMETVARMELEDLPEIIETCSMVYMPEVGYLLAVPAWRSNLTEKDLIMPNSEFKFVLNNVVHYKTARCQEMDDELGDNHLIILKHETEIQYEIVTYIQKNLSFITAILEKMKILDCLLALSHVAGQYGMTKPELKEDEQLIAIKNGRHILTQEQVEVFIPNDFVSSSADSLVKIFTGPNSCGKSVYLKQVALIVYLAHIGSFVPADSAVMGLVDSIHTRIQTIESISKELSAFMLDLRQMYSSIYNSSKNSLIIIDEFGKGTADVDGIALLYACLDHFLRRGIHCPHILVATHFHMIPDLLASSPLVKPQTFEFLIENENIAYLFKVKDGSSGNSFARLAALGVGFPRKIVDRADEILGILRSEEAVELKPANDNPRFLLQERRKQCLRELRTLKNTKTVIDDDVLLDIRRLLDNVRI